MNTQDAIEDFRRTGEGEMFFGLLDDIFQLHPEEISVLEKCFQEETDLSFKEIWAYAILIYKHDQTIIDYLKNEFGWSEENGDFTGYKGFPEY